MIEEGTDLVLIVLANALLQPLVVPELIDVLLLAVLHNDLTAYPALGRVSVACNSVRGQLRRLDH